MKKLTFFSIFTFALFLVGFSSKDAVNTEEYLPVSKSENTTKKITLPPPPPGDYYVEVSLPSTNCSEGWDASVSIDGTELCSFNSFGGPQVCGGYADFCSQIEISFIGSPGNCSGYFWVCYYQTTSNGYGIIGPGTCNSYYLQQPKFIHPITTIGSCSQY